MTEDEIRSEFDRLADGYDLLVPRHIALALAKLVADIADRRAREECAKICDELKAELLINYEVQSYGAEKCADEIRDMLPEQ